MNNIFVYVTEAMVSKYSDEIKTKDDLGSTDWAVIPQPGVITMIPIHKVTSISTKNETGEPLGTNDWDRKFYPSAKAVVRLDTTDSKFRYLRIEESMEEIEGRIKDMCTEDNNDADA